MALTPKAITNNYNDREVELSPEMIQLIVPVNDTEGILTKINILVEEGGDSIKIVATD